MGAIIGPMTATRSTRTTRSTRRPAAPRRRKPDPVLAWAKRLARTRPGLVEFVLGRLAERYGTPVWSRVHDPTSELVLTTLSQNTADINAEHAFELLRARYPHPVAPPEGPTLVNRPGWGGAGLHDAAAPDWQAVEDAPLDELVEAIRPGGLAPRRRPASRPRCGASGRNAATTRWSSSATCPRSRRAHG